MNRSPAPVQDYRGLLILALGVASVILAFIAPIIGVLVGATAWSMASKDLKAMSGPKSIAADRRATSWGLISGIVGSSVSLAFLLLSGLALLYYAKKGPQIIEDPVTITIANTPGSK